MPGRHSQPHPVALDLESITLNTSQLSDVRVIPQFDPIPTLPPENPLKYYPMKSIVLSIIAASSLVMQARPLKIYILAGQSNMTGMVKNSTLEHIKMSPASAKEFADMFDAKGNPVELDLVQVSCWPKETELNGKLKPGYGGGESRFGPEYGFGVYMFKKLRQPILIIKCGQGGRNLYFNFRPPSAGVWAPPQGHPDLVKPGNFMPGPVDPNNSKTIVSYEYNKMITHVRNVLSNLESYYPGYYPEAGYELSGFVWFQGWNDMIDKGVYPNRSQPGGYDQYTWLLEHLIRDVRKDLNAPKMPFVIGVMGMGGVQDPKTSDIGRFQQAQIAAAKNPEFKGTVAAVETGKFWDFELDELIGRAQAPKKTPGANLKPLTPKEENILKVGVSDAYYHYLGSGKIMAAIGKGFADTMLELEAKKR